MVENKRNCLPIIIKVHRSTFIVFSSIFGFLMILSVVALAKSPEAGIVFLVLLFGVVAAFVAIWLRSFRVALLDDQIEYSTIVRPKIIIPYLEIDSVEEKVGGSNYAAKFKPNHRLEITSKDEGASVGKKKIVINLKLLSLEEIAKLRDTLDVKLREGFDERDS